jgi:hypothetical protein
MNTRRPTPTIRIRRVAAAATVSLYGTGACGAGPAGARPFDLVPVGAPPPFVDAAGPARLDRSLKAVRLDHGRNVELSSWRFEPAPGRSAARDSYWCGVALEGQALTVIGVGPTESVSCAGLAEVGPLPKGRIGLIYRTTSPNADSLSAVVLTKTGSVWSLDERATERLLVASPPNLPAMLKLLE